MQPDEAREGDGRQAGYRGGDLVGVPKDAVLTIDGDRAEIEDQEFK
jgi:hypothetical protein